MEFWFDNGTWYCRTPRKTYCLTAEKTEGFVSANMREKALAGLVSPVLALQIMRLFLEDGEPPRAFARPMLDVVAATTAPEGQCTPDRVSWEKAHAPLSGPKLHSLGILHKHVSLGRHMLANVTLAIRPPKPKDAKALNNAVVESINKALADTGGDLDAAAEAGTATLMRSLDRRVSKRALTGDWIVFEVIGGRPYFLCLFPHPAENEDRDDELAALVQFVRGHWSRPNSARG